MTKNLDNREKWERLLYKAKVSLDEKKFDAVNDYISQIMPIMEEMKADGASFEEDERVLLNSILCELKTSLEVEKDTMLKDLKSIQNQNRINKTYSSL